MTVLLVGLGLFIGVHTVSIVGVRSRLVAVLGEGPWRGVHALLATVGLVAMVYGYAEAQRAATLVYVTPYAMRYVALALMCVASSLMFAAYLPGRISRFVRHPLLAAMVLWAAAHLLVNGMTHDIVLFGSLLAWAALDWGSFSWRRQRPIATAPPSAFNDALATFGGLASTALMAWLLHAWLFGVAPLPL